MTRRTCLLIFVYLSFGYLINAQHEVELRTDGIVVPRTTTGAVTSPVEGMLIYDTSIDSYQYYDGTSWSRIGSAPFERVGTLVRPREGYATDDFVFGRSALPFFGTISDTLMFFDQSRGAFRGGSIDTNVWVFFKLGQNSFGYGYNVEASGRSSVAMGDSTVASNTASIAMGSGTLASGSQSTAMGIRTIASGSQSTAMGHETIAFGNRSTAMGDKTTANGFHSTAMGDETTASGSSSTAMGYRATASGFHSTAMGDETTASGSSSTAMGDGTTASGIGATAMGIGTIASATWSTAIGNHTTASGTNSTAVGRLTTASGSSTTAMGEGTVASSRVAAAVGMYNDPLSTNNSGINPVDPLFMIGNGDDTLSRSNAFVVKKNGEVSFQHYAFPIADGSSDQVLSTDGSGQLGWTTREDDWSNTGSDIHFSLGSVGIGDSTPDAFVEISKNSTGSTPHLLLTETELSDFVRLRFENTGNSGFWTIATEKAATPIENRMIFNMDGLSANDFLTLRGDGAHQMEGTLTQSSDVRLKRNISKLENRNLDLLQLHGYSYNWKNPDRTQVTQIGLIAQEVRKYFPELVDENDEGMLSVNYIGLIPVLIESTKDQQTIIEQLQLELKEMKDLLKSLINKQ